jgi:Tfp pilus assembly protein PilZ
VPITLEVASPAELAERYYPNGRAGGLTVEGRAPTAVGQRVSLRVLVRRPKREFLVEGQLAWARYQPVRGQPPAFGVDFRPDDDGARVRLLAFARQELSPEATRVEERHEVALPCTVKHRGEVRREQLADLSTRGAFIRTWNPPAVGEDVELSLRPPLSLTSVTLHATVAWARRVGDHPGMGLEFHPGPEQRERLARLVARLARR